jgi:hypothetical protein
MLRFKLGYNTVNLIRVICGIMLLLAIFDFNYSYYQLLRVVVFIVSIICLKYFYELDRVAWCWFYAILAILFNPFAPIYLSKEVWHLINVFSAIIVIGSIAANKK